MGEVRCGKIPFYRDPNILDKTHPTIPGYININVTSGNATWKGLSPMKLGPFYLTEKIIPMTHYPTGILPGFEKVDDTNQRLLVQVFENIWQGSKVYAIDIVNGVLQQSFFQRRANLAKDTQGHRRALPKKGNTVITSYWNGNLYDYIPSRKFYCNIYASLVVNTPEYQRLQTMLAQGTNLHIIGYDGKDIPVTQNDMDVAIRDPTHPFGHELVLCCLLKGLSPWLNL